MNFRTTIILLVLLAGGGIFLFVANRHADNTDATQSGFDAKGKKLFEQKADDVAKLVIRPADPGAKPIELAKQEGNWKLVQPVSWGAESFEARNLVDSIVDLRSKGGVDLDSANLSSTGLDHPRFTIEATDTTGKTTKIDVGNRSALGNDLYVKVGDDKSGQLVAGGGLADKLDKGLDKLADSLRDKQLVKITSTTARRLDVTHKDQKLALAKEGDDWKIVEPRPAPADSSAVSDLLFALTDLKADSYIDPASPEAADARFDRPKATVFLSAAAPSTQPTTTQPAGVTLTFGQFASVDRDKIYVKLSDPPIIARAAMTQSSLDRITGASVVALRDKKVVDIDPARVTGITLAIDHPSTTQPTTRPAEQSEFTLARRKEKPVTFGPLPPPVTQPASTEPASTQAATPGPASQPAVASTQPASKWVVESGGSGDAIDADVDALLAALHPLTAVKYLDMPPTTQPAGTYAITIHAGPGAGKGPEDFNFRFTNPGATGNVIGSYQDLVFELDRAILDKLDAKFRAPK